MRGSLMDDCVRGNCALVFISMLRYIVPRISWGATFIQLWYDEKKMLME